MWGEGDDSRAIVAALDAFGARLIPQLLECS
jgi:hypothetical protein